MVYSHWTHVLNHPVDVENQSSSSVQSHEEVIYQHSEIHDIIMFSA